MMWAIKDDKSEAVITAKRSVESRMRGRIDILPKTCVLFFCRCAIDYLLDNYQVNIILNELPRFLGSTPCISVKGNEDICFMAGGCGAPQAADTIETVVAMGAKRIVAIGLCGVFVPNIKLYDLIIPNKAYVEEGTSLHYIENANYSEPSVYLLDEAFDYFHPKHSTYSAPIVSTDAVYRQTFEKEEQWRIQGCIGVDMEVSAVFNVCDYLHIDKVAIMMASDIHPLHKNTDEWKWSLSQVMRNQFISECIKFTLGMGK